MNLAIQDAVELGVALRERYAEDPRGRRLSAYSSNRLPAIWRTQEFSNWMLMLLHAGMSHAGGRTSDRSGESSEFAYRLRRARIEELIRSPRLSAWFAHAYAGVCP